jgi:hypothetical protein
MYRKYIANQVDLKILAKIMQVRSCLVHLVMLNTMVKTEFKMDII